MSLSVFIVEDDPMVAEINRRVVEKIAKFKVVGASSSERDALDKIANLKPDLVLLDIYLSGGNGIEILKHIRQTELPTDVILVTAAKDVQTVYATLRYGAIDYIIKPFDLERLRAALNTYCQMRKILNKKDEVKQEDLDRISHRIEAESDEIGGSIQNLPKGVHQLTLEHIITAMIKENKPLTCQEIASLIAMSKITVWRYLEYLVDNKKIKYTLSYGMTGRPSKKYYIPETLHYAQ